MSLANTKYGEPFTLTTLEKAERIRGQQAPGWLVQMDWQIRRLLNFIVCSKVK